VPPSAAATAPTTKEEDQPIVEVGLIIGAAKIASSAPSSILTKRKRDDGVGTLGRKKSKALLSLRALRQAAGLMPGSGRPSSLQD